MSEEIRLVSSRLSSMTTALAFSRNEGRLPMRERQRAIFQQMPGFVGVLTGPDHVFDVRQ